MGLNPHRMLVEASRTTSLVSMNRDLTQQHNVFYDNKEETLKTDDRT